MSVYNNDKKSVKKINQVKLYINNNQSHALVETRRKRVLESDDLFITKTVHCVYAPETFSTRSLRVVFRCTMPEMKINLVK